VRRLLRRWHEDGNTAALSSLITEALPLVDYAARQRARTEREYEDLVALGYLAMIKAIDRYETVDGVDPVLHLHAWIGAALEMVVPAPVAEGTPERDEDRPRCATARDQRDSVVPAQ
jgi:DNA-directed RNA polymerase sigma subunit (sigma70/sigma32)